MPIAGGEMALPGFEQLVETCAETDVRDVGADLRECNFTGERLAKNYPGKYALAARAFFEKMRSAESICDILQISPQTMHALIERECVARGILSIKQHIRAKAASATHKALCKLQVLLDDEAAIRKAGIVGLTSAIRALTPEDSAEQKPSGNSEDKENYESEYIDMMEQNGVYGLGREKNCAPREDESNETRGAGDACENHGNDTERTDRHDA